MTPAVARFAIEIGRTLGQRGGPLAVALLSGDRAQRKQRAGRAGDVAQLLPEREALLGELGGPVVVALPCRKACSRMQSPGTKLRRLRGTSFERFVEPVTSLGQVSTNPPELPERGRQP